MKHRGPIVAATLLFASFLPALPLAGQLDSSCKVSALNRTASVQAGGVWVLPNVPANQGPIRVRATCVDNGVTRSGQSDLLTVPANGVIEVESIRFDAPVPVPGVLRLTAPATTLGTAGQTLDLTAVATYADGSSADVTPAAAGTSYRSSNPAIAEVDGAGRVTARTSGRVLVSALNEGALGVITMQVVLSGDADGDGLPDDFELANGLDPNNPADSIDDPDGDGLSTFDELQAGLDPFDPDTDDDRLQDGAEAGFGTDPRLFDTDGYRVSDGLEVTAGSDPLNRLSVNLAPILAGLQVDPPAFTIVYNTILGEGSRRVTVTATLVDGTRLDATGAPYGTTYGSTHLAVASFGLEPGRIFAGANGTAAITASNGTFSATAEVTVQAFSPQALSFLPLPGAANDLALDGAYAYVACGGADLQVVDVSNLSQPRLVASRSFPGEAFDVVVADGVAYVAAGSNGLVTVDVGNPLAPVVLGSIRTPGTALAVAVRDGIAYVADGRGLRLFDVTDPAAPVALGQISLPGRPRGIALTENLAVVAAEREGIQVLDVSDPALPRVVGSTQTRGCCLSNAADVVVRGRLAYVADGATTLGGIKVIDLSVPSTPVVVGASSDAFGLSGMAVEGGFALGADYFFVNGVPIFGIGALRPAFSSVLDFSRAPSMRDDNGMGIAVRDGAVFLAADDANTYRFGVNGRSALHIGRYVRLEEVNTVPRPPSVVLTAPVAGASIRERRLLSLAANATDDVRVAFVRFLVDGQPVATDFTAPYSHSFEVPDGAAQLTVTAEAEDLAGNRAAGEPVTVTVLADTDPAIRFLSPAPGLPLPWGSTAVIAVEATDDTAVRQVDFYLDGELLASASDLPYRFDYGLPPSGVTGFTVEAVATDDIGQTATTGPRVVAVDPDEPPVVALLEPQAGTALVAGGLVRLRAGAADDVGLAEVRYWIDGADVAADVAPPFEHAFQVDPGASEVRLSVVAMDSLGQQTSSAELVLPVEPDPGTDVEGRVVDLAGEPVANASVSCLGLQAVSGADGRFSVATVPTARGTVTCQASVLLAGETLAGTSVPVSPQPGGVTDAGDIAVASSLLYLTDGGSQPGRLFVFDEALGRVLPWSEPLPDAEAVTGLAFDAAGRLWATAPERPIEAIRSFGNRGTRLLLLDPETGEVQNDLGTFEDPETGDLPKIVDLTFDLGAETLYGLAASGFGEDAELAVLALDLENRYVRTVAAGFTGEPGGLAAADGLLHLLAFSGGSGTLRAIDPVTGAVLSTRATADPGLVRGMAPAPGGRSLRVVTATDLLQLDPQTGLFTLLASPTGPVTGGFQALAWRPLQRPPVTTVLAGRVVDEQGLPAPDAEVSYLGGTVTPAADGTFATGAVQVRTDLVRVIVDAVPQRVLGPAVLPVPGGITDFGDIETIGKACIEGLLSYSSSCSTEPVTGTLTLELQGTQEGEWLPAGIVVPGPDGGFCATLRRGFSYRLRQEAVACTWGTAVCETSLAVYDFGAWGSCTDEDHQCEDAGAVELFCGASGQP